jgi:hypothetical protein
MAGERHGMCESAPTSNCGANWTAHNLVSSCWLLSAPDSQLAKCNSIRYKEIHVYSDVAVCSSPCLYHWPLRGRKAVILQWRAGLMFIEQGCPYRRWPRFGERIQTHWRMSDWMWLQSDCQYVVVKDVTTSSDYDEPVWSTAFYTEAVALMSRQRLRCVRTCCALTGGVPISRVTASQSVWSVQAVLRSRYCLYMMWIVRHTKFLVTDSSFRVSVTWTTLCRSWLIWIMFKDPVRTAQ